MEIQVRSCSESEQEKTRGLMIDLIAYTAAFMAAAVPFSRVDDPLTAVAVFTGVATLLLYIVSVIYKDVSVYDPYWSVAPPVMMLAVMLKYRLWNVNAVILLGLILIWAIRLTANWYATYRGIGHEDWRYANFRKKVPPVPFQVISFFGFHFVPTAAVYGGMTCAVMAAQQEHFALLSAIGAGIMLLAVWLEYVSDRAIHRFLREHGRTSRTCDVSVWKYSRHPNYLGEMLFWTGLYLYFAAVRPEIWYAGLGFLAIIAIFLFISIPMMEQHNLERRADYAAYQARTPVLIPLPGKDR